MTDWNALLGCDPAEFCSRVYEARPPWIEGYIAYDDARFLFARALESGASGIIEIGTASGLSTAVLCEAANLAHRAGLIGSDFFVESYDIDERFYANRDHRTGDAAREMLDPQLLEHVTFRNPKTAADVAVYHEADSISFAFIDAAHTHPWPTIDLLTLLPTLRPGSEVLLHDINLPVVDAEHAVWGAKWLYDELDVEKRHDAIRQPPNIGSITVPEDKAALREQLTALVHAHEWETQIDDETVRAALA